MDCITIDRCPDGFGSQLLSIISGIAYAKVNALRYLHTPISNLKLVDKLEFQNSELDKCNTLINSVIENLGLKHIAESDEYTKYSFFHKIIKSEGVEKYYNVLFLNELANSYPSFMSKPDCFDNNFNIKIHIRRGADILEHDKKYRYIDSEFYEEIIKILKKKYPKSIIHIFSWNDSGINEGESIVFHKSETGDIFLNDFNAMVHSDILVVGSSSLSMVAGMFNKNTVICNDCLFKCTDPIPISWIENFCKNFPEILEYNTLNNFKFWEKK